MLTIKTHQKHVNDVVMVFLLLTLNLFHTFFSVSIVDFEQVNIRADWHFRSLNKEKDEL